MPKVKFLKGCIYAHGKHAKVGDILNIEDSEFKSLKRMGKVELFKEEENKMTDIQVPIENITQATNIEATDIDVVAKTDDISEDTETKDIEIVSATDDASEAISENIDVVAETEEAVTDNTKKSGEEKSSKKRVK